MYTELAEKTGLSASNIACSDWFHGPVIHEISRRAGYIRIDATDNVYVAKVRVTFTDERGKALEQGKARRVYNAWWEIETRTAGNTRGEVWDLAGNLARREA